MTTKPGDPPPSEVTGLLDAWSHGEEGAFERLMPLVVDELRRVAAAFMRHEPAGHTLEPTALVNEVYLRFAGRDRVQWKNRAQFFAVAAETMRHVLVDHARKRKALRRGGQVVRVTLDSGLELAAGEEGTDLVALDDALHALAALDERQARVVELRYFTGLTLEEAAEVLGVSTMTVKRDWRMARRFLFRELRRA